MKKNALIATLLGTSLLLGACADKDKVKDEKPAPETEEVQGDTQENIVDKSETASSDEDLAEAFNEEKGASNVRIIVTEDAGGFVLVDFDVDDDLTEDEANELIEKYEKSIIEKYKDYSIDIQGRKGGETFAQKTVEK